MSAFPLLATPMSPTRTSTPARPTQRPRYVMRVCAALVAVLSALELAAQPASPPRDPSPHSDAVLVAEAATVMPGKTVTVGVRLTLDPGWHTYWTNPGDAGLPLEVRWNLPDGVVAGPLRFPTPRLTPQPPLMSYGYESEVFVLSEITVPATATPGTTINIAGNAEWLACADVCLPASGQLALSLPVSASAGAPTRWSGAISSTRASLPVAAAHWRTHSWTTDAGYTLAIIAGDMPRTMAAPYFFVDSASILEHAAPQRVARAGDTLIFSLPRAQLSPVQAAALRGTLTPNTDDPAPRGWLVSAAVNARPPAALRERAVALLADVSARQYGGVRTPGTESLAAATALPDPGADMTLLAAVCFAFIGGLLLNLMPCVFPVLSIKVLSLLEQRGNSGRSQARTHGLSFTAGVLVSFWVLAGVLMALRAGGAHLGWGFQLQSPVVVSLLALLLFALGLNLSGVFEIGLSLTRLGNAGAGTRYRDSFLTGTLAVLVAAPCTAPFMGAALGFALVQPALIGLLVFTALALGLALPFALLAAVPAWLRFLPRPGPWLETLKQFFAFPLYATVVWLLWVLGQQAGIDALAVVLLAMIGLAMGAWWWARGVRAASTTTRAVAGVVMLSAIAAAWFGAARATPPSTVAAVIPGWEPWSEARVRTLRQEGRPVFVDFTAAWCLSCQVNERVALRTRAVQDAFSQSNVALLRADWTSRDSSITNVLASFGRSGVPLYLLYPADARAAARILPAVLTPGMVVDAVARATPTTVVSGVR
jgi:thiol:disulfide interchange protein/DsbC/DsbD-like thiol-disulfide interchange protein